MSRRSALFSVKTSVPPPNRCVRVHPFVYPQLQTLKAKKIACSKPLQRALYEWVLFVRTFPKFGFYRKFANNTALL